ncbi:hypothetical protein HRbin09_01582 [bacterium HR09]|nr:hypothetical protein HRbin09_01582 [bacterium HR09]
MNLRAGSPEHHLRHAPFRFLADKRAPFRRSRRRRRQHRQLLPGEDEGGGAVSAAERLAPASHGFVGVGRSPNLQVGDGPHAGKVLHRLVGGAVFPQANGIVGEDVNHRQLLQGGKAQGGAQVVRKHQKRGHVGPQAPVERQAVGHGGHGVLPHAKAQVAAAVGAGGYVAFTGQKRVVGRGKIGRATQKLGDFGGQGVEGFPRGFPGGQGLFRWKRKRKLIPPRRKLSGKPAGKLGGQLREALLVLLPEALPFLVASRTFPRELRKVLADFLRHKEELLVGPAQVFPGGAVLFGA